MKIDFKQYVRQYNRGKQLQKLELQLVAKIINITLKWNILVSENFYVPIFTDYIDSFNLFLTIIVHIRLASTSNQSEYFSL